MIRTLLVILNCRITDVRPSNSGIYRCNAKTSAGQQSEDYTLSIEGKTFNL